MNKFRNIQKGVITTVFGLVIIGVTVHQYVETGEFNYGEIVAFLAGMGFLFSKDQASSHTK
jgi:hypothetical protein